MAYEQGDSVDAPPKGGVVFAGSSSVRMWKTLAEDLAPLPVLNRGFGGSTFPELLHYADRIIFAYEPRCVVLYEGDNDIAADSMQPEDVLANLQVYLEQAEKAIPGSQTYFLAVKPSIRRKELLPKAQRTNALIRQFAAQTEGLFFLDVASVMMESETQIRSDIFIQDSLHMNPTGYALWTEVVRPALMAGCQ
ncbi:MAG: GDSL-type esterase/lipase family protein [Bacteroidota bacterium]